MPLWVVVIVAVVLVAVVALFFYARRSRPLEPPGMPIAIPSGGLEQQARRQALQVHGNELLERRVDLESRRGTLTGDDQVFDALVAVQDRFQRGEITEDEYEAEKVRLLSG